MIRIENLTLRVGNFALDDVSLDVPSGTYFVLLGPSGSGKTLLLESICGLNRIASGRISVGDREVTHLEPRRRGIGYLPQDYALFPHMTVRRNVAFGLTNHRPPDGNIAARVDELMELVGVSKLADRLPRNLSGGEKQRVALARAVAIRPKVVLLDEPVSALDEQTRDELCRQLKELQQTTGTTVIHVCHNFAEMLAVADRVGIVHQGHILQVGTPKSILECPKNAFIAQFVQAGNLFSARANLEADWLRLKCPGGVEFRAPRPESGLVDDQVEFMVRPEHVHVTQARKAEMPSGTTFFEGQASEVKDVGPLVRLVVECGQGMQFVVLLGKKEYNTHLPTPGERVHLAVAPSDVHVLDK